jgi:hypothetical protein
VSFEHERLTFELEGVSFEHERSALELERLSLEQQRFCQPPCLDARRAMNWELGGECISLESKRLSNQNAHIFALSKRCGQHGRELAAVCDHLPDVHFADGVVHLRSAANYPNLHSIAMRIAQQFVELCRHCYSPCMLVWILREKIKATASQAACVAEVCRSDRIDTALPVV